jgi:hypothetical protein
MEPLQLLTAVSLLYMRMLALLRMAAQVTLMVTTGASDDDENFWSQPHIMAALAEEGIAVDPLDDEDERPRPQQGGSRITAAYLLGMSSRACRWDFRCVLKLYMTHKFLRTGLASMYRSSSKLRRHSICLLDSTHAAAIVPAHSRQSRCSAHASGHPQTRTIWWRSTIARSPPSRRSSTPLLS